MATKPKHPGAELFAKGEPVTARIYERLLAAMAPLGPISIEVKQTCVHLCGAKSAFGGVHPRKSGVLLTIRSTKPIKSQRVRKSEAVSANRAHNDVLLSDPKEIDRELVGWLAQGLMLSGGPTD